MLDNIVLSTLSTSANTINYDFASVPLYGEVAGGIMGALCLLGSAICLGIIIKFSLMANHNTNAEKRNQYKKAAIQAFFSLLIPGLIVFVAFIVCICFKPTQPNIGSAFEHICTCGTGTYLSGN